MGPRAFGDRGSDLFICAMRHGALRNTVRRSDVRHQFGRLCEQGSRVFERGGT
ncbi:MAG: hypothetical protein ACI9W2_004130 [Gammaproteobacteria bacterium]|jgi:hypothetical protein